MHLLLVLLACAPEPALEPVEEPWPEVDALALDALESGEVMGFAVAIVLDGELAYARGYGLSDGRQQVEAERTLFRLASMSKMLTATATLAAADEGLLDLDEDVAPLVDAWTPPSLVRGSDGVSPLSEPAVVTPRQLLGHLSGLTRMRDMRGQGTPSDDELRDHEGDTDFTWAFGYWEDEPFAYMPGEVYNYSTYGVNLVGAAVEGATGSPLHSWLGSRVLEPLGVDPAYVRPEYWWEPLDNKAAPYTLRDRGPERNDGVDYASASLPGSGFIASAGAMGRFCAGLLSRAPEGWQEALWTSQVDGEGEEISYGLGTRLGALDDGRRAVGHVGGMVGGAGRFVALPDEGSCVVVLSNTRYFEASELATALLELVP